LGRASTLPLSFLLENKMARIKDIPVGTRFGYLIILSFAGIGKKQHAEWRCLCDCGKETIVPGYALRRGSTQSCGHTFTTAGTRSVNFKDLTGKVFGRWTVLDKYEIRKSKAGKKRTCWLCRCECGREKFVISGQLTFGSTTQCKNCAMRDEYGASARKTVLNGYKKEAEERGYSWLLSDEQFDQITKQNCKYCGIGPSNVRDLKYGNGSFIYSGIDRLDNSRGYEIDNVAPCCRICNRAKDVRSVSDFISWAKQITEIATQGI
jgi:hypothetical protein